MLTSNNMVGGYDNKMYFIVIAAICVLKVPFNPITNQPNVCSGKKKLMQRCMESLSLHNSDNTLLSKLINQSEIIKIFSRFFIEFLTEIMRTN